jgi:hypothetical protein
MTRSARVSLSLASGLASLYLNACSGDDSPPPDGPACGTGGPEALIDGSWTNDVEDWCDPGTPGNDTIEPVCGVPGQTAHHHFTTAVHAIHTHTGQILMFHGQKDQRVWTIGESPDTITWHPLPLQRPYPFTPTDLESLNYPDMFCAGHVQLADGRIFIAGGNVTGGAGDGGLIDTFLFEPLNAQPASDTTCPFGWGLELTDGVWENPSPNMAHDRWYPTLTTLGDGRVLIAGGFSRKAAEIENCTVGQPGCMCTMDGGCDADSRCFDGWCVPTAVRSRLLEVYDPGTGTITPLLGAEFPLASMPIYPLMFLLPNGDVLYAGSEDAQSIAEADGRILIPDYNNPNGATWSWLPNRTFTSEITGASAVMYEPGKILKTGGRDEDTIGGSNQVDDAELIDLSGFDSGQYDAAPAAFTPVESMAHARHFHNTVVLPNGRVLVVGGNRRGNSSSRDHYNNPCEWNGQSIAELNCSEGCPSICMEQTIGEVCGMGGASFDLTCSNINNFPCENNEECSAALPNAYCESGFCKRDCAEVGDFCGLVQRDDCTTCNPYNNECFAVKTAEMWDPSCASGAWVELGDQDSPRMYHSTALLLPDGRVLSMGGGHRDFGAWATLAEYPVSEYFAPRYSEEPNAVRPAFELVASSEGPDNELFLPWGGWLRVEVQNGVSVSRATLVRLGSTTHGFDQDQRFIELALDPERGGAYTVSLPTLPRNQPSVQHRNIAPPGYYMLFLLSNLGQPSLGHYVRVGASGSVSGYSAGFAVPDKVGQ